MSKVSAFRKAALKGRKQLSEAIGKKKKSKEVTIKVYNGETTEEFKLDVHMKPWSIKEYCDFRELQWTTKEDSDELVKSSVDNMVAAVIVGSYDENGERHFEVEDAEMLSVLNVSLVAELSSEIMTVAEITDSIVSAEK